LGLDPATSGRGPAKNIAMTAELEVVEAILTVVVVVGVVLPVEVEAIVDVGAAIMLEVATKLEAVSLSSGTKGGRRSSTCKGRGSRST
jgi:hypothetical protein